MKCTRFQKLSSAYLDDQAPRDLRARMESHLGTCDSCRRALESARALSALLRAQSAPPVPDGFAQRVLARARSQRLSAPSRLGVRDLVHRMLDSLRPVSAATAAVLAMGLILGALMGHDLGRIRSSSRSPHVSAGDPLEGYDLDYLSEAPRGSLPHTVLTLNR
jgi:anti-sigma factor RsiW